jgi:hypothetical protein
VNGSNDTEGTAASPTETLSAAHMVLDKVDFEACPVCGAALDPTEALHTHCYLCKAASSEARPPALGWSSDAVRQDLDARIADLQQSAQRHARALKRQQGLLDILRRERALLDQQIAAAVATYESERTARTRRLDAELAALQERVGFLERVKAMPVDVAKVQAEADAISAEIERVRRQIAEEEGRLRGAEANYVAIEDNYKRILLSIGFPGVFETDLVILNRRTFIPEIWTNGIEERKWTFFDAGSGGKKTMLKICFALALHKTAAERELPVPRLLIIDSPMKNITPDINPIIFRNFYNYVYDLLDSELKAWQVIIVDQTYYPADDRNFEVVERMMTRDDPNFPPLIRYYFGA